MRRLFTDNFLICKITGGTIKDANERQTKPGDDVFLDHCSPELMLEKSHAL